MNRGAYLILSLFLFGCSDKDKADDTAGPTGTDDKCDTTATSYPTNGTADAYYKDELYFKLSAADTTATITSDIPGSQLLGDDGVTLYWVPDGDLAPSTTYTMTLTYCAGESTVTFTTSDLGTALDDPSSLDGRTYVLKLADANFVEPAGIGSVLGNIITTDILVGVQSATTVVQMVGAVAAEDGSQDVCSPSIGFPEADFAGQPYFVIGPEDTTLSVAGFEIPIKQLEITGTFAADGTYFGGGTLGGTIDARDLADVLADAGVPVEEVCELVATFGAACEACDDGELYCLTLKANQIVAEEAVGVSVEVVTQADIDANASCAE